MHSKPVARILAEYRRVGVNLAELDALVTAAQNAWITAHPEIEWEEIIVDDDTPPDPATETLNPPSYHLALTVLASLPDGAGTAAFLAAMRASGGQKGDRQHGEPDQYA
jgi:hypothetical protein